MSYFINGCLNWCRVIQVQVLKIGTAQVQVPSTTSLVIVFEIFSF